MAAEEVTPIEPDERTALPPDRRPIEKRRKQRRDVSVETPPMRQRRRRSLILFPGFVATVALLFHFFVLMMTVFATGGSAASSSSSSPSSSSDFVVDAETGTECVDRNPQCPFWAATGECEKNKGYMGDNCKKSCDRCHVVRVKDRSEMNRFLANKKKEIEAQRELYNKEQEMMKVITEKPKLNRKKRPVLNVPRRDSANDAADNGDNKSGDKNIKIRAQSAVESEDSSSNGGKKRSNGKNKHRGAPGNIDELRALIEEDKKTKVDFPPSVRDKINSKRESATTKTRSPRQRSESKTKTKAKPEPKPTENEKKKKNKKKQIDAETGLECVDSDPHNCPIWAAAGQCEKNRNLGRNCKLSCDRCHIVRVRNERDMNRFISRKTRETAPEREERRKQKEALRILKGGSPLGDEL